MPSSPAHGNPATLTAPYTHQACSTGSGSQELAFIGDDDDLPCVGQKSQKGTRDSIMDLDTSGTNEEDTMEGIHLDITEGSIVEGSPDLNMAATSRDFDIEELRDASPAYHHAQLTESVLYAAVNSGTPTSLVQGDPAGFSGMEDEGLVLDAGDQGTCGHMLASLQVNAGEGGTISEPQLSDYPELVELVSRSLQQQAGGSTVSPLSAEPSVSPSIITDSQGSVAFNSHNIRTSTPLPDINQENIDARQGAFQTFPMFGGKPLTFLPPPFQDDSQVDDVEPQSTLGAAQCTGTTASNQHSVANIEGIKWVTIGTDHTPHPIKTGCIRVPLMSVSSAANMVVPTSLSQLSAANWPHLPGGQVQVVTINKNVPATPSPIQTSTPSQPDYTISEDSNDSESSRSGGSYLSPPPPPYNTPASGVSILKHDACTPIQLQAAITKSNLPEIYKEVEQSRHMHNAKERQRRARIKDSCDVMRKMVPGMTSKTDKATVFEFAVHYMKYLHSLASQEELEKIDKQFLEQCSYN